MHRRVKKTPIAQINVVPYIDVMLVLLIIFMVTAPLVTQGVKVDLPPTNAEKIATADKKPIIISIKQNGSLYFNLNKNPEEPLSRVELLQLVNKVYQNDNKLPILVRADKAATHGAVTEIMSLLQSSGINKIGIVTQAQHTKKP